MSYLLGKPAAELVGAGMQLIDGMRSRGLPVPPEFWLKARPASSANSFYDKIEHHINGLIQVVKPTVELNRIVREGFCRSPERPASTAFQNMPRRRTVGRKRVARSTRPAAASVLTSTPEQTALGTSEPVTVRTSTVDVPVSTQGSDEIIDLTEDSPVNTALRRKRTHGDDNELANESDLRIILDDTDDSLHRTKKPALLFDLDTTINVDQSENALDESENNKSLSCPICLENCFGSNIKPVTTPCGHIFCFECLKKVSQTTKKCSICQRQLVLKHCIRLHI